jgi:putative ABC transport system ATP-binding protein
MIEVKNLTKTYSNGMVETTVLRDISLVINQGEFVSIIGPSGAGKSTLMYQISLLDEPTSGKIIIDSDDMGMRSGVEKTNYRLNNLGYVFQDYALLPELTAAENVMVPLLMQGMDKADAFTKSVAVLERIGLKERINNLPSQLSGGQQQRVSIARAIAHNPKILFADEPTANLDTKTSREILETFIELNNKGQTIIMVTHEQEFARVSKRIIELKDGMVVSDKKTIK